MIRQKANPFNQTLNSKKLILKIKFKLKEKMLNLLISKKK